MLSFFFMPSRICKFGYWDMLESSHVVRPLVDRLHRRVCLQISRKTTIRPILGTKE